MPYKTILTMDAEEIRDICLTALEEYTDWSAEAIHAAYAANEETVNQAFNALSDTLIANDAAGIS